MEAEVPASELKVEESWIENRMSAARKLHPISDSTAEILRGLLRDRMTKRQLKPTELTDAASKLLASMKSKAPSRTSPVP